MTPSPIARRRVEFLDLDFDTLAIADVLAWLAARDAESDFGYIVTPNVDHMVRFAEALAVVRDAYRAADLLVCDSRVLARLARFAGVKLSVVPGSDVVARLFADVLVPGDRVCLIGGSADDAARLAALYPALDIRHHAPPLGLRNNAAARAAAVAFAASTGARIVLLAVGSPQQEMIAHEMAQAGTVGGTALCIGAAVDFVVGAQRRAPGPIQRAGMEWAWRLASNPGRLARRYLVDGPAIFPQVWRWRATHGKRAK